MKHTDTKHYRVSNEHSITIDDAVCDVPLNSETFTTRNNDNRKNTRHKAVA